MKRATEDELLAFALEWQQLANAASSSSRAMATAGAPMSLVSEGLALARRALELARRLEEHAAKAAPTSHRD